MAKWTEPDKRLDVPYNANTKFVCIEHPALVQNVDKALTTLGGVDAIAEAYSGQNKRLALYWRPDDFYCKPAYADSHKTTNLLMRVKRRRKKNGNQTKFNAEVVGTVEVTFKFQGVADFQYLPMVRKEDGGYKNIYDQIYVSDITSKEDYFSRDVPLFIPPLLFSRCDVPVDYLYQNDSQLRVPEKNPDAHRPDHLIGTVRQRRTLHTIFVNFGDTLPTEPIPGAREKLKSQFIDPKWEVELKALLDKKPLWLKAELEDTISCPNDKLKILLPISCFYWLDGPWRAQWNKFGYDPTKTPEAKIYQTVDFRIRQSSKQLDVKAKRSDARPTLWTKLQRNKGKVAHIDLAAIAENKEKANNPSTSRSADKELLYIFKPDSLPIQRLTYYQTGSIEIEEIKALVHQNDGREAKCTERDGWCIENIYGKCRAIMNEYIQKIQDKELSLEAKFANKLKTSRAPTLGIDSEDQDEEETMNVDSSGADNQEPKEDNSTAMETEEQQSVQEVMGENG